ncbi:MAG: hypothetical protein F6K10_14950 [Moorea sp. SIO2B7]|nr:hypothetical protein [Moorena sp. SIO2B7]
MEQQKSYFHLGWHDDLSPMTYLVTDNSFLLWFKDDDDKFCINIEDYHIANALWSLGRKKSKVIDLQELLSMIQLH